MRRSLTWLATVSLVWGATTSAHAFTTRVHIALSNEVRQALIASEDGRTIQLRWSTYAVQIPQEDADAIVHQPLAFRAGSIGPDNVVFPAMTDGTHGVTQDPYRQCEILHQEALTETERAYALGCLLHGATDAIAHHFVNHFTGETFTLNPISASRASDYDNAIGHIVTESIIQSAYHAADPTALSGTALEHDIPQDFVLRMYFDVESPVWQRMAEEPISKWDAARAADPGGTVLDWAQSAGFGPWEQIAMAPVYIAELQALREGVRTTMTDRIATLAADPELGVTAGPDGTIGTPDDATACSSGCPTKFGEYYVLVRMLAPRMDAAGNPLPSAFDKISDSLGDDLYGFLPALVQVIANLSRELNTPIPAGDTEDHGLDITPAIIADVFGPIDDWGDRTFAIDYETLGRAVSPTWYTELSDFLSSFGVSVSIPNIMRSLLAPIVDQIRDALMSEVRDRARTFIDELSTEYRARYGGWSTDVEGALAASAPADLGGHALAHAADSGLFTYAFNITAATLANHEVMLVGGDPIPDGPTSFDASYTMSWTQLGLCDYLREAVFPEGTDVRALLSVRQGETLFAAQLEQDSPVECHDGALDAFGAASAATCEQTDLERLLAARRGSLTRAYPPAFASGMPQCRDVIVPGLPDPPERPDAGMVGIDGSVPGADAGPGAMTPTSGGCCSVAPGAGSGGAGGGALALVLLALVGAWRGRRRDAARVVSLCVIGASSVIALGACSDAPVAGTDASMLDAGETPEDAQIGEDSGEEPEDAGNVDAGPDLRRDFLATLDGTVWSGLQTRDEGGVAVRRAYEVRFRSSDLFWGEIRNPFGPGRQRILRQFSIARGGCPNAFTCEASSTILIPEDWETPEPLRGDRETWTIELIEGSPRALAITNADGVEEIFDEGAWPAPTTGLTVEVRRFDSSGTLESQWCGSGSDMDRNVLWDYARGRSSEPVLGSDVVVGARLTELRDDSGENRFSITDVPGFDPGTLGGTELSDSFHWIVRYTGTIMHPGGALAMREANDQVEDAVWGFVGSGVGGTPAFLEVHGWLWPDRTSDEPSMTMPAGPVDVELIILRCAVPIVPITMQVRLGGGAWTTVADAPTAPRIDAALFPPVL